MENHSVEVTLTGSLTTVDVYLEGREITLRSSSSGFHRKFDSLLIDGELDLFVLLKGWPNGSWGIEVKVDGKDSFKQEGVFGSKAYVSFTKTITP